MVHGFNNPEPAVLSWFASASAAIEADDCLVRRPGLVCVGYRWPSEHMGQPLRGTVAASPALLSGILWAGLLFLAVSLAYVVLRRGGIQQRFQLAGVGDLHPAEPRSPLVECRIADAVLPAHVGRVDRISTLPNR
jgi:hypothetical protein